MKSRSKMNILGMMSGTSMDAVDCILVEILITLNNDFKFKIIEQTSFKIPSSIRSKIIKAIEKPKLNLFLTKDYHKNWKKLCKELFLNI